MDLKSRIKNLSLKKRQLLTLRVEKEALRSGKQRNPEEKRSPEDETSKPNPNNPLPMNNRLLAYVVPQEGKTIQSSELRSYLRERLPYYMVPNNVFILESIPLGPNAKIDRQALENIARDTTSEKKEPPIEPRNHVEAQLIKIWKNVLRIQHLGVHDNFFELGGDSILSIQIISKAKQEGLAFTANQLFQNQSIAELAPLVESRIAPQSEQKAIEGLVPLTPIQHWFFDQNLPDPQQWNQALVLKPNPMVTYEVLNQALVKLIAHHDNLRASFSQENGSWQQSISSTYSHAPVKKIDLSQHHVDTHPTRIAEHASREHKQLNLKEGKLVQGLYFQSREPESHRFVLIIHHLVMDGISWRIVLEDLVRACHQLLENKTITFPEKTTSFKLWSERLQTYAQSERMNHQIEFWTAEEFKQCTPIPQDIQSENHLNTVRTVKKESSNLPKKETHALLHEISQVYNTKINEILLTALVQTFSAWSGNDSLFLGLEGHGREELFENMDISRTIGWFTSYFPVYLKLNNPSDPEQSIIDVKEQFRKIPMNGIGYGLLRYCSKDPSILAAMKSLSEPQICFNYLGTMGQESPTGKLFERSLESIGEARSLDGTRPYLLEINTFMREEQFCIDCSYSDKFHQQSTIRELVSRYIETLADLIRHCQVPTSGKYSPADFPESGLNQGELDDFISKITQ